MLDKITEISLLYDFYGKLLSRRQQQVLELYHEENYSLSEIADEFGISRQGVHDALKNGEKALYGYEEKLGLVERFEESRHIIDEIDRCIDGILADGKLEPGLALEISKVREIIDSMEDDV